MRRISLALALFGAIAAAGCGGSKSPSSSGNSKGTPGATYTVDVRGDLYWFDAASATTVNRPQYGTISTADGRINCGGANALCSATFAWTDTVVLTATPTGAYFFEGWAGDCTGAESTCTLTPGADKLVLVRFSGSRHGHPNWSDPSIHASAYMAYITNARGHLDCNTCHGADLHGLSIAPSCFSCHSTALPTSSAVSGNWSPYPSSFLSAHFDVTGAAWQTHAPSGWTGGAGGCLRCHTGQGYQDYIGLDGSAEYASTVTWGATTSTTIAGTGLAGAYATGPLKCSTCHNSVSDPSSAGITTVTFPSLVQVTTDKATAVCAQCHQARESTVSVNTAIGSTAVDAVMSGTTTGTSFKNPHYLGAAATMWGSVAQGWAQYPGKIYTRENKHAGVLAGSCVSCHDPHTLTIEVNASTCGKCHFDETTGAPITSMAQLEEGRQFGFADVDIDGDGAVEGLKAEIDGLKAKLTTALQVYAQTVVAPTLGANQYGVCFSGNSYPYFFQHAGGPGDCTAAELAAAKAYKMWTPRSLRAAYNLKFASTDSAAWAHNPRYAIEVLFDAINDVNAGLSAANKVAFNGVRTFTGHFGGYSMDPTGANTAGAGAFLRSGWYPNFSSGTSPFCSTCHGGEQGFADYLARKDATPGYPTGGSTAPQVTGLACTTCHAPQAGDAAFTRMRTITSVYFPLQAANSATQWDPASAGTWITAKDLVCMTCHAGRASSSSPGVPNLVGKNAVDYGIANMFDATTATTITGPKNAHDIPMAQYIVGNQAHMLYEYAADATKGLTGEYAGPSVFFTSPHGSPHGARCTGCHRPQGTKHTFEIDFTYCGGCHTTEPYGDFRLDRIQLDLTAILNQVPAKIAAYSATAAAPVVPICVNATGSWKVLAAGQTAQPDGTCGTATLNAAGVVTYDATLYKAFYNYNNVKNEFAAYAHNYEYAAQALIDSMVDLAGTTTGVLDQLPTSSKVAPWNVQLIRP